MALCNATVLCKQRWAAVASFLCAKDVQGNVCRLRIGGVKDGPCVNAAFS